MSSYGELTASDRKENTAYRHVTFGNIIQYTGQTSNIKDEQDDIVHNNNGILSNAGDLYNLTY